MEDNFDIMFRNATTQKEKKRVQEMWEEASKMSYGDKVKYMTKDGFKTLEELQKGAEGTCQRNLGANVGLGCLPRIPFHGILRQKTGTGDWMLGL